MSLRKGIASKMAATLLLVGRDGNGKSSTGNSILGHKAFVPRSSNQAGSGEIVSGISFTDDINVVDGPGIGDTNINDPDDVNLTLQNVEKALQLPVCSTGFTALVIVFKYGVRFTKQEKDTVYLIKSIFGDNIFKDYGIVVMTCGDNFEADNEEEKTSFEAWCDAQTGDIKNLFEECGNRRVLFNNRAKDESSLKIQRDLLLATVAKIQSVTRPYSWTDYTNAVNGRNRMIVFSRKSQLREETKQFLGEINKSIGRIDINGNPEGAIKTIAELLRQVRGHKRHLETEAQNTDIMKDLLLQVNVLESNLKTKENLAEQTLRKKEFDNAQPHLYEATGLVERNDPRNDGILVQFGLVFIGIVTFIYHIILYFYRSIKSKF